ncbi:hypothetical protein CPB84DRAFT_1965701 [Gymnopilus junonius]|uniref:F-box domain-containing protein n=1 Tax=Gymnopilus junonius TaxID=109634 RepID=A0A9P5NDB5_GYMJU|nr:hypothetical protein CPB84DRAFT_1965701 [Gymnopilus junonius]
MITSIPHELLQLIFWLMAEDPCLEIPPRTVRLVCHFWRDVARSVPELSSTLPTISMAKSQTPTVSALEAHIDQLPPTTLLSFRVVEPRYYDHPVLNHLIKYSERWKHVSLELQHSYLSGLNNAMDQLYDKHIHYQLSLPNLQFLKLKIVKESSIEGKLARLFDYDLLNMRPYLSTRFFKAFYVAPQLRDVEIEYHGSIWNVAWLPYGPLRRYVEYTKTKPFGIHQVMNYKGEFLEDLTYIAQKSVHLYPTATFHRLKSLDHRIYSGSTHFQSFLECLTLPALERLRILDNGNNIISATVALIDRSGCNLTKLSLYSKVLEAGELTQLLERAPLIMELECNDIPVSDMKAFYPISNGRCLAPRLKNIVVHCSSPERELATMIESRSDGNYQHTVDQLNSRLVFPTFKECMTAWALFEGWSMPSDVKLRKLKMLAGSLESKIALWSGKSPSEPNNWKESKVSSKIDAILAEIEDEAKIACTSNTCGYIKMSGIHIPVYKIICMGPTGIPHDAKYQFSSRTKNLLNLWIPSLQSDSQARQRRWILEGKSSLIQIKPESGATLEEEDLLFGRPQTIPDADLFWWKCRPF